MWDILMLVPSMVLLLRFLWASSTEVVSRASSAAIYPFRLIMSIRGKSHPAM
jgi:hypothetical protein